MELIAEGAEAKIFLENDRIIKKRIKKDYRIEELDIPIRKSRTRREAKVLVKMPKEVCSPDLIDMDDKDMTITMAYLDGEKVADVLDTQVSLMKEIGKKTAIMHNAGIIHGDLTTSNMIYHNGKVGFIDFGLSYFSEKYEDKAVDLHLVRQALESKHYKVYAKAYSLFLENYQAEADNADDIIKRLDLVEKRGRNKKKGH